MTSEKFKKSTKLEINKFAALNFVLLGENKKLEDENLELKESLKRMKLGYSLTKKFLDSAIEELLGLPAASLFDEIGDDICDSKTLEEFFLALSLIDHGHDIVRYVSYVIEKSTVKDVIQNYKKLRKLVGLGVYSEDHILGSLEDIIKNVYDYSSEKMIATVLKNHIKKQATK